EDSIAAGSALVPPPAVGQVNVQVPDRCWTGDPATEGSPPEDPVPASLHVEEVVPPALAADDPGPAADLDSDEAPPDRSLESDDRVLIRLQPHRGPDPRVGYLNDWVVHSDA